MVDDNGTWYESLRNEALSDPETMEEYEAYKLQLELASRLKKARKKAKLTQEEVAKQMLTSKSAIARLEAAGGKSKHSPSLNTLSHYAYALGYQLKVSLVPRHTK